MLTTSPTLADPSRSFFDIRGSSDKSGPERLLADRSGGGFSSLLDGLRDDRRGPQLTDAPSSRPESAQESSDEAQSLPDDDGAVGETDVSPGQSKNASEEIPVEVDDAEVADHSDANGDEAGEVNDDAGVIVASDEEEAEGDTEDETDQPDEGRVVREHGLPHAGDAAAVSAVPADQQVDADADDEDQAERRVERRGRDGDRSSHVSQERDHPDRKAKSEAHRPDKPASQPVKPVESPGPAHRGSDVHHVQPTGTNSRAKMTDEATPPPHLHDTAKAQPDRIEIRREPIVLDQPANREHRVIPAASRVQQVESQVRLENASAQSGATDISSRIAVAASGGSNGQSLNGEQNGQNLPSQTFGSAERATPDDARFSSRVVRGLTAMINQRGGTMTMRLDPPDLGQMRVQMTLARGTVSASFFTQTHQARALLEKNMAALRTALENQGLTVERLNVQSSPSSNQQGHLMNDDSTQRQQEQQRQDAAGGESRGRREEAEGDHHEHQRSTAFADVIEQFADDRENRS